MIQTHWLTQTKFHPPRLRDDLMMRRRLLNVLEAAVQTHRLTLISAPAGYGKTTLLSLLPRTFPALPVAWLSLDQEDNDPNSFLSALIAALQRLHPACGVTTLTVLSNLANPSAEIRRVMGVLINDILETLPAPFLLVLDDLHVISEPTVYQALDYLLERLPAHMHLVAGTRHDPPLALARLRAREELAELRLDDLRFTLSETTTLFNEQLRLGLSAADLTTLYGHTEGWAAGLRLLASSLQLRLPFAQRSDFISRVAQSNRYIFDLLAEEVLHQQRADVQQFLLETSILDELTPPLCGAVTTRPDAGAVLEELYRHNLFIMALDEQETIVSDKSANPTPAAGHFPLATYRYHDLFAAFLRQQLAQTMPERLSALHRRAANAQTRPTRAIYHYLAGELWGEAAQTIAKVGEQLLQQGWLASLQKWIMALPPAMQQTQPQLAYLLGVCAWHQRRLADAAFFLEQALAGFEQIGAHTQQGQTLAYLSELAYLKVEFSQGLALIEQALACPIKPHTRVQLLLTRARVAFFQAHFMAGDSDVDAATQIVQQTGDLDALYALLEGSVLGFAALPGRLDRLGQLCQFASARVGEDNPLLQGVLAEQRLIFHFYRGELALALQYGLQAQGLGERLGGRPPRQYWMLHTFLLTAHLLAGHKREVDTIIDQLLAQQNDIHIIAKAGFLLMLGRVCWLAGRLADMRRTFERLEPLQDGVTAPTDLLRSTLFQGMLALAEGHYPAAKRLLQTSVALENEIPMFNNFGSARILLAHLYLKLGLLADAVAETTAALAEVAAQGAPGRILMEGATAVPLLQLAIAHERHTALANRLLETLSAGRPPATLPIAIADTGETLSIREVEVLGLIADGANNQQIAETLVLSPHTVKRHVANILAKLNVVSRTQAAARARALGIVA